jgi:hypothetical protein
LAIPQTGIVAYRAVVAVPVTGLFGGLVDDLWFVDRA